MAAPPPPAPAAGAPNAWVGDAAWVAPQGANNSGAMAPPGGPIRYRGVDRTCAPGRCVWEEDTTMPGTFKVSCRHRCQGGGARRATRHVRKNRKASRKNRKNRKASRKNKKSRKASSKNRKNRKSSRKNKKSRKN
jgi:hypothetical protein